MDETQRVRASSFGPAAAEYERGHPSYPDAAVDWMVAGGAGDAVDVGAGTGKFTRQLLARGLEVTAVDPDPAMLDQLRSSSPEVRTLAGTAESIPLPDSSTDLVTLAQAWHWVDEDLAYPEVARVLRAGGSLALIWNFRANETGWMKELAEIITDRVEQDEVDEVLTFHPRFEEFEYRVFPWSQTLTREQLHDLVKSRSIYIVATPDEQRRVLEAVDDLLDTHPDVAGLNQYELPYRTHTYRGRVKK